MLTEASIVVQFAVGELAGIYVFTTPSEAEKYGSTLKGETYVVLTGTEVETAVVEDDSTLLTDWTVVEEPMPRDEFVARHVKRKTNAVLRRDDK